VSAISNNRPGLVGDPRPVNGAALCWPNNSEFEQVVRLNAEQFVTTNLRFRGARSRRESPGATSSLPVPFFPPWIKDGRIPTARRDRAAK